MPLATHRDGSHRANSFESCSVAVFPKRPRGSPLPTICCLRLASVSGSPGSDELASSGANTYPTPTRNHRFRLCGPRLADCMPLASHPRFPIGVDAPNLG